MAIYDLHGTQVNVNDIIRFTQTQGGRSRQNYAVVVLTGRKYLTVKTSPHSDEIALTGVNVVHAGSTASWETSIRQARRDAANAYVEYLSLECPATESAWHEAQRALNNLAAIYFRLTSKKVHGIL